MEIPYSYKSCPIDSLGNVRLISMYVNFQSPQAKWRNRLHAVQDFAIPARFLIRIDLNASETKRWYQNALLLNSVNVKKMNGHSRLFIMQLNNLTQPS